MTNDIAFLGKAFTSETLPQKIPKHSEKLWNLCFVYILSKAKNWFYNSWEERCLLLPQTEIHQWRDDSISCGFEKPIFNISIFIVVNLIFLQIISKSGGYEPCRSDRPIQRQRGIQRTHLLSQSGCKKYINTLNRYRYIKPLPYFILCPRR